MKLSTVAVSTSIPAYSGAVYAASSTGVTALAAGADWNVGTTSDPGSGNWRIWGSVSGAVIKNNSGTSRQVTVLMIG